MTLLSLYNKSKPLVKDKFAEEDKEYIYLFYNHITKLSKIGITSTPKERLRRLSCEGGVRLKKVVVLELEVGYDEKADEIEKFVHLFFKSKRTIGEWFDLSFEEIIQIVVFLQEGIGGVEVDDNAYKGLGLDEEDYDVLYEKIYSLN